MESGRLQRERKKDELLSSKEQSVRTSSAVRLGSPLTFNDTRPAGLPLGQGFGSLATAHPLQAKLTVNEPGDQYEQEADRVAEQVMRMPESGSLPNKFSASDSSSAGYVSNHTAPARIDETLRAPSQQLDSATRRFMESRFSADFSQVRVHTDVAAGESSQSISALAYTRGNDVVFAPGQYAPQTQAGRRLLAHELTHVLQQRSGMPQSDSLNISTVSNADHIQRGFGELRVAEARMLEEELSIVDGEFWILPPRMRDDVYPIFDDEETGVVIGFRTRGSVVSSFDLEGRLVDITEPGLETPLIDPIDILAGGLTGLGRGAVRGTARGLAAAGRGGARLLVAGAAVRALASRLARHVVTAIRGVYRAIRFRGALNFTGTTLVRMLDPARRVPHHILKLAIRFGARTPDPQGVAGAFRYVIPMVRNGTTYTLEVVLREADQTVLHFLYR